MEILEKLQYNTYYDKREIVNIYNTYYDKV